MRVKSGHDLKAGTWRQELIQKPRWIPAYLPLSSLTQPYISYISYISLYFLGCPVQVWTCQNELDSSAGTSIKKINADLCTSQYGGETFSISVHSYKMTLACVKLTHKITSTGLFWKATISNESEELVEVNSNKKGVTMGNMQVTCRHLRGQLGRSNIFKMEIWLKKRSNKMFGVRQAL